MAKYMKERSVFIDVFDADSRFQFATAKIKLSDLLRQGQQKKMC